MWLVEVRSQEIQDSNSSDGSNSQGCLFDDDNIFGMKACEQKDLSAGYRKSFLYSNTHAVTQVAHMLRDHPLVPLTNTNRKDCIMDVNDKRLWPS